MPSKTDRLPFTSDYARRPYTKQPVNGVARAAARLEEHRKAFAQVDLTPIPSRQQRRVEERAFMKRVRSADKAEALRSGATGGAAACR